MTRPTEAARGYGPRHLALRKQWEHRLNSGEIHLCAKCDEPINPFGEWDLGHTDDRTGWTGPEHVYCNRAAGARNATRVRENRKRTIKRTW